MLTTQDFWLSQPVTLATRKTRQFRQQRRSHLSPNPNPSPILLSVLRDAGRQDRGKHELATTISVVSTRLSQRQNWQCRRPQPCSTQWQATRAHRATRAKGNEKQEMRLHHPRRGVLLSRRQARLSQLPKRKSRVPTQSKARHDYHDPVSPVPALQPDRYRKGKPCTTHLSRLSNSNVYRAHRSKVGQRE